MPLEPDYLVFEPHGENEYKAMLFGTHRATFVFYKGLGRYVLHDAAGNRVEGKEHSQASSPKEFRFMFTWALNLGRLPQVDGVVDGG